MYSNTYEYEYILPRPASLNCLSTMVVKAGIDTRKSETQFENLLLLVGYWL